MANSGVGTSAPVDVAQLNGSYSLAQLVSRWRRKLDDALTPYLWSNDELTEYADNLQKQLCAEFFLIEDRRTPEICSISLVQGDSLLALSPRILKIKLAYIEGADTQLKVRTADFMDENFPGWDSDTTQGDPVYLVTRGVGMGEAWLYPVMPEAGTLNLVVYRLPLFDLDYSEHAGMSLEIDRFAHLLTHGIMWQAYDKNDDGANNPLKAEEQRVLWEGRNGLGGDKEKIRKMAMYSDNTPRTASPMAAFT